MLMSNTFFNFRFGFTVKEISYLALMISVRRYVNLVPVDQSLMNIVTYSTVVELLSFSNYYQLFLPVHGDQYDCDVDYLS